MPSADHAAVNHHRDFTEAERPWSEADVPATTRPVGLLDGRNRSRPFLRRSSCLRKRRVKGVPRVPRDVERKVEHVQGSFFPAPRFSGFDPRDERVLAHPLRQPALPRFREGKAPPAPDAREPDPELFGEQAAERETKRRTLRVSRVVVANARPKRLPARSRVRGGAFGAMPTYRSALPSTTTAFETSIRGSGARAKYQP